ncbi:3-isopropylmalate dehydrogenase [Dehalococcoidia bacterium]|nr:3-isopropylmalate dehydrogenase [Dehalococcoidia bacterium]MCL0064998.1 3-isopropylmalate dehydrogenase [Dehalococcoidia bacterium]MCL0070281.1 3-isopropylmalate dehydrogenase [Dehalococcoidia bacterium]
MRFTVAVLPGDGVGPEVAAEGVRVLKRVGERFGHEFDLQYGDIGGVSIDNHGLALTPQTLKMCKRCDAVYLGAVGGPRWDDPLAKVRPEDGLLGLRKGLGLFANLRPVKVFPMLVDSSNLKPDVVRGVDLVFVRELTGGLYFGKPKKRWETPRGRRVVDTLAYSEREIERIIRVGFELARTRRKKLTSVDKANVLESSRLWRQIATEIASEYPDVELEHQLVDACAMRLIQRPADIDVLVTENMFGDILTDEASMLGGSMGMLPSASLAGVPRGGVSRAFGMYEPIHGSAPRRAGQNIANPIATILSCALMLRYSFGLPREAGAVEGAVNQVLEEGYRTYDIMAEGMKQIGTREMGELIAERI